MDPLISVIVPVYNAEKYLDRCVSSILSQTYKKLEIILVDDGSVDTSPEKCDAYAAEDERIKVIYKTNGGVCSARNAGLDACNGSYVGFVDCDDKIAPEMYEQLLYLCQEKCCVATVGVHNFDESGSVTIKRSFSDKLITKEEFISNILCRKDGSAVWNRLFPREVIGNARFDEQRLNEELLFWMSVICRVEKVAYSSFMGYYYYKSEGSLSRVFGKSVHDMVGNSKTVRQFVDSNFPSLAQKTEQFEIYQHMKFALACPSDYDRKKDPLCGEVSSYLRKNVFKGLKTPYFSKKDKIKLIAVAFFPKTVSKLIEKKNRKKYE